MTRAERHPLWNGGKIYHLIGGTIVNLLTQLVTAYALFKGWAPEKEQLAITLIGILSGLSAQVYGVASAAMMSYEDYLTTLSSLPAIAPAPAPTVNPNPTGGL